MNRVSLNRQTGAILLLVLLFLMLGGFSWLAASRQPPRREFTIGEKLAMAKESLLGYAAAYPELRDTRKGMVPGHLPCPYAGASLSEGIEEGNCGATGVSVLGHLPWRSLGLPPLRDNEGECFWYLVSGNHKANPKSDLLNFDTPGLIEILLEDGQTVIADNVLAVLFASGKPLSGQNRSYPKSKDGKERECRADFDPSQYLDSIAGVTNHTPNSASEGITRVALGNNEHINDRLVWITRDEWQTRLEARLPPETFFADEARGDAPALTQRVAACLMSFGDANEFGRLPWAAPLELIDSPPKTFHVGKFTDQKNRLTGRPPYSITQSRIAIGADRFTCGFLGDCSAAGAIIPPYEDNLLIRKKCPDFRMVDGNPPNGSQTYNNSQDGLWDKWKDHLFYLVSPNYAPAAITAETCEVLPDGCLQVAGKPYAAAVIFAGEALPDQKRANEGRMDAAQYLEGENAISLRYGGKTLTISGNDQISCITGEADGLRLVANCGRNDCRAQANAWLACQEHGSQTGGQANISCAAPESFMGCPCKGTASRWQQENCIPASPRPICRRLLARMKSCA